MTEVLQRATKFPSENGQTYHTDVQIVSPNHWGKFISTENLPGSYQEIAGMPTSEYLGHINHLASGIVNSADYRDPLTGFISKNAWKTMVDGGMLAASFGDRDNERRQEEIMQVARILSFHDISLGLSFGITTGLAIMPLQEFGSPEQQEKYLGLLRQGAMIGLAITERDRSGSTALEMDSQYRKNGDGTVSLSFAKQFQGVSGNDGLIVAAVKADAAKKTIGLFIVDKEDIDTLQTKMMGLSGISYGVNTGNVELNEQDHLMTEFSGRGLFAFQGLFTKSRFLFVGMTLGHQERMEREAEQYAGERMIGKVLQRDMDYPRYALETIRTRREIAQAVFERVAGYRDEAGKSLIDGNTLDLVMEANIVKTLPTAYAIVSSQDRAVLKGGRGFMEGDALQDYIDIWPFQIFEGTEPMLEGQIGHEYARKPIREGEEDLASLFNRVGACTNLDNQSLAQLETIPYKQLTKVQEAIVGKIVLRLFALGCLTEDTMGQASFMKAKRLLNLEIAQQLLVLKDVMSDEDL